MPATKTDRLKGLTTSVAVKAPVLVASTGDISTSSTQTIDGIAVSTGDRVLVKEQSDASENGIYVVDSGDWARATDFDGSRDVVRGTVVYVAAGSANGNLWFVVDSTGNNIPGTNDISFAQAAGLTATNTFAGEIDTNGNALNFSEGTDVASASTANIWVSDGNTVHVTGGVTIASFSTAPRIGAIRNVIFDSTLSLTHSTTALIIPGSSDIVTQAGDIARIYAESTILARVLNYERVSGRSLERTPPFETVSSSGATMASSGISVVTSATSTARTFVVGSPSTGLGKEILIEGTATAITLDSSATTISFATSGGSISTSLTYAGAESGGGAVVLRGRSGTRWHVLSKTDGWT